MRAAVKSLRTGPAAIVVAAVLAGVVIGTRPHQESPDPSLDREVVGRTLAVLDTLAGGGRFPAAQSALAALTAALPGVRFEQMAGPYSSSPDVVGVYILPRSVWVRAEGTSATTEARQDIIASKFVTFGPALVSTNMTQDGSFDEPLNPAWVVQAGPIARVSRDSVTRRTATASLRIDGTGSGGLVATTVTQTVSTRSPQGTNYVLSLFAKSLRLSRPLAVELRLDYRGGSFQFFSGVAIQGHKVSVGVPAGSTNGWAPMIVDAIATRPVEDVVIFAVDTRLQPLTGTAWLDDLALHES